MDFTSGESGGLLALGAPAARMMAMRGEMERLWRELEVCPVWLPSLRSHLPVGLHAHPQQVGAEHGRGALPHAACLPLFDELPDAENRVYGGFGVVHRLEPLGALDPRGRLEAFTVAETVIVGEPAFCEEAYRRVHAALTSWLSGHLRGRWELAGDPFAEGLARKEEWRTGEGARRLSVASGNVHGHHFLAPRGLRGVSCCFGVGIERMLEALRRQG
ncbi:MAG: hypothetical protein ABIO70_32305 [Pseudomonadota bacterium]